MTWMMEISLIDLIIRYIAGICAITGFILIIIDQRKTKKFLKEERPQGDGLYD